jgi:hypothetical protein
MDPAVVAAAATAWQPDDVDLELLCGVAAVDGGDSDGETVASATTKRSAARAEAAAAATAAADAARRLRLARQRTKRARFPRRDRGPHLVDAQTLARDGDACERARRRALGRSARGDALGAAAELRVAAELCADRVGAAELHAALASALLDGGDAPRAVAACRRGEAALDALGATSGARAAVARAALVGCHGVACGKLARHDEGAALCARAADLAAPHAATHATARSVAAEASYGLGVCRLGACRHGDAYRAFAKGLLASRVCNDAHTAPTAPASPGAFDAAGALRREVAKRGAYYPRVAGATLAAVAAALAGGAAGDVPETAPGVAEASWLVAHGVRRPEAHGVGADEFAGDALVGKLMREPSYDLVFATVAPVAPPADCARLVALAEAADAWRDDRHGAVPTTDVALADLGGEALALFNGLLASALLPLAARTFGESRRFRVHDAFLVKYDAAGGQVDLPVHADQADVSLTVALNGLGDYDGGGTRFEAADGTARRAPPAVPNDALAPPLTRAAPPRPAAGGVVRPDVGEVVVFASRLRHAAAPITRGRRYVLAVFLYDHDAAAAAAPQPPRVAAWPRWGR